MTAGVVSGPRALLQKVDLMRRYLGGVLDPMAAFALARGLKTLPVRIARHNATAGHVARFLERDRRVARVYYPGLRVASRPRDRAGADVGFRRHGDASRCRAASTAPRACSTGSRLIRRATSLGGVDSLVSLPVLTSHYNYSDEDLRRAGVTAGMLRVSVGLEDEADLIEDLDQALG